MTMEERCDHCIVKLKAAAPDASRWSISRLCLHYPERGTTQYFVQFSAQIGTENVPAMGDGFCVSNPSPEDATDAVIAEYQERKHKIRDVVSNAEASMGLVAINNADAITAPPHRMAEVAAEAQQAQMASEAQP